MSVQQTATTEKSNLTQAVQRGLVDPIKIRFSKLDEAHSNLQVQVECLCKTQQRVFWIASAALLFSLASAVAGILLLLR